VKEKKEEEKVCKLNRNSSYEAKVSKTGMAMAIERISVA